MLSNYKVAEGLLIAVLGANFVLLFFIAWHVATVRLYFAGAAARQKRLLEQLQAAKESLRPPVSVADNDDTSAALKEAKPPKRTDERPEHNHNWVARWR